MSVSVQEVLAHRASRDAAKATFDRRYQAIRADMDERGIAGRILDETVEKAVDVFDEAVDLVGEHPAMAGGTLAAFALWIFRTPLLAWVENLLRTDPDQDEETDDG